MNTPSTEAARALLIIANPAAAQGRARQRWQQVEQILTQSQQHYDIAWTNAPAHATALAREAAQHGVHTVACVGGDGTVNEVVNGLMQVGDSAHAEQRPTLALIPIGTGTDFARSLGVTCQLPQAVQVALHGTSRSIDVGCVTCESKSGLLTRHFINVAGLGFDAEGAALLAARGKRAGKFAYFGMVFQLLRHYKNKRLQIQVGTPAGERQFSGTFNSVIAANARYFGSGMKIAPQADLSDGLLDVLLIGDMPPLNFIAQFLKIYRGTHLPHPQIQFMRAQWLTVQPQPQETGSVLLEAESEVFGHAPARISLQPRALNVMTAG